MVRSWCLCRRLSGKLNEAKPRRWRLNTDILEKQEKRNKVEEAIKEYLSHNDTAGHDPRLIWDAMKATIRGTLIDIKANMNKQENKRLNDLEKEIKKLELEHIADMEDREKLNNLNINMTTIEF